jgi:hypothetical protein
MWPGPHAHLSFTDFARMHAQTSWNTDTVCGSASAGSHQFVFLKNANPFPASGYCLGHRVYIHGGYKLTLLRICFLQMKGKNKCVQVNKKAGSYGPLDFMPVILEHLATAQQDAFPQTGCKHYISHEQYVLYCAHSTCAGISLSV